MKVVPIDPTPAMRDSTIARLRELITQMESGDCVMFIGCYLSKDGIDNKPTYFYLQDGSVNDCLAAATLLKHRVLMEYLS
jgi:uncharacterized membrane protein